MASIKITVELILHVDGFFSKERGSHYVNQIHNVFAGEPSPSTEIESLDDLTSYLIDEMQDDLADAYAAVLP